MDQALQHWAQTSLRRRGEAADELSSWQALRVEASYRRFYRVRTGTGSFVVMSSPPKRENNGPFVTLARVFRERGVEVPEILDADTDRGWFLLSDLGDTHFEDVYQRQSPDVVLPAALATLHRLQQVDDPRVPPYTRQRFEDELGIYSDWFLGRLLEIGVPAALDDSFDVLVAATEAQPVCCVHRDYHCRNLLLTPRGTVGVVDFQDALIGPATYDLASLLRDCYYTFSEAEVARWRDAYLATTALPVDRSRFARDMDFTALQRQLKAIGIFARLWLRDGRTTHLPHIVSVLERVGTLAGEYPELETLARHASDVLPQARERVEARP